MSTKVAVTAAGGGVGQSIIKSLKDTEYESVAIDPSNQAAGLYMADYGYIGKNYTDPEFIDSLISICHGSGAKYLFSGFDAELEVISEQAEKLRASGITPIISTPDVITLSEDKFALMKFLEFKNLPFTPTYDYETGGCAGIPEEPVILKPRTGCRSQGFMRFPTRWEANSNIEAGSQQIMQSYIEGEEYTCGTVSFDGDVKGIICMTRELRSGDTYKARVNQNPMVMEFLRELISEIKPFGPCNVQLIVRDNIPYVLEINARCSGTTAARTLAGFNEPEMVLNYLRGEKVSHYVENGLNIFRYWQELVVRPRDEEELR